MPVVVTALGWIGAVTCLTAYVLVTQGRWSPTSGRYQLANVLSGLMLGTVAASSGVWPSVVTNLVWAAVALHAGVVLLRRRAALRLASSPAVPAAPLTADLPVAPPARGPLLTSTPTPRAGADDAPAHAPVVDLAA